MISKKILILFCFLLPLRSNSQNQDLRFDDSLFSKFVSKFKKQFNINDSFGIQKNANARVFLSELNRQAKTKIFIKAKILNEFQYLNSYNDQKITLGLIEFEFDKNSDANFAFSKLKKVKFIDTWRCCEMFSCCKRRQNRILFIYSPSVLIEKMESFMRNICQ